MYCLRSFLTTDLREFVPNTSFRNDGSLSVNRWTIFWARSMWIELDCMDRTGLRGSKFDIMLKYMGFQHKTSW